MWPVLVSLFIIEVTSLRTAHLKGNLLYETERQQTVRINPHYVQFNRQFDLSNIKYALDLLDNYTVSYHEYCKEVTIDRKRGQDTFQASGKFFYGFDTCRNLHGHLPEVKDDSDADKLVGLMKVVGLSETPAGLSLVNQSSAMVYSRTNDPNKYHRYQPCENCNILNILQGNAIHAHIPKGALRTIVYAIDKDGKLYIKLATYCNNLAKFCDKASGAVILCTRGTEFNSNILNAMVSHSCKRDTNFIAETNKFLRIEYESFLHPQPQTNENSRRRRSAVSVRRKRFVPALPWIAGGMMGGGVMSSVFGRNPFEFVGEIVGGIFGLATAREMKLTRQMIGHLSYQLEAVKVNQKAIVEACLGLMDHAQKLETMIRFQSHDTGVMYGELDSKIGMRYLQSVIQMTLLKIHGSIIAARQYKPSPYVFGANDLSAIGANPLYNQQKLTTNIDEVAMALSIVENNYTFLIAVPIVDEKTRFQTFTIKKLPIFHAGKTYTIQTQHANYGINLPTNEYAILTDAEYNSCSQTSICSIPGPIYSINSLSPCEIKTFITNRQTCPLELAPPATPTFLNYGNTTYYSVPEPVDVHVRCTIRNTLKTRHEKIEGIGSFQAHTGCITQVTESAQVRPIHIAEIHDLASNSIFGVLKQFDFSSVTYPPDPNLNQTTTAKPLTILEVNSLGDGLKLLLDIQTTSTDVARVFVVIFAFLLLFFIVYACFTPFRLWFNNCMSCTKPGKYWERYYDNVPQFIRIKPKANSHIHERIQRMVSAVRKPFISKPTVKQPTSDFMDDETLKKNNNGPGEAV